jgi:nucleotide-binding universal stress UspA family protein
VLLVIGHGGHGGPHALPLGSVASRIARRAACPVIVYRAYDRAHPPAQRRPVLAAVNAPGGSPSVLEFAFEEAAVRGAPLTVSYVWSQPPGSRPAAIHPEAYDYRQAREEAERMLAEALAGLCGKYPDVPVRQDVRHSLDVAGTLIEMSAEAQLAVVGRHERSGLADLLLGSVSHAMIEKALCPVAVIGAH